MTMNSSYKTFASFFDNITYNNIDNNVFSGFILSAHFAEQKITSYIDNVFSDIENTYDVNLLNNCLLSFCNKHEKLLNIIHNSFKKYIDKNIKQFENDIQQNNFTIQKLFDFQKSFFDKTWKVIKFMAPMYRIISTKKHNIILLISKHVYYKDVLCHHYESHDLMYYAFNSLKFENEDFDDNINHFMTIINSQNNYYHMLIDKEKKKNVFDVVFTCNIQNDDTINQIVLKIDNYIRSVYNHTGTENTVDSIIDTICKYRKICDQKKFDKEYFSCSLKRIHDYENIDLEFEKTLGSLLTGSNIELFFKGVQDKLTKIKKIEPVAVDLINQNQEKSFYKER